MNDDTTPLFGANVDTRPEEAKQKDRFQVELVASVAPVVWKEKRPGTSDWRSFEDQNQDGSGSCVAQTVKKLAQILVWLEENEDALISFSATSIYIHRSNKPDGGMIGVEAFDIWKDKGISLEALVPSQNMNDAQMDAVKVKDYENKIGAIFQIGGHVGIANGDFEAVASTIQQTGKGVMTWFYFISKEWSPEFPKILDPNITIPTGSRHSVAAVDFGLINGKKYIKIEDSAQFGGRTVRYISEEFFKARNWFTRYPMNFKFQAGFTEPSPAPTPGKPVYHFTKPLVFIPLDKNGNISDLALHTSQKADVVALQDILRFEGVYPTNVNSTGYYGATTAKAVYNYQKKYAVAPSWELEPLQGKRVGEKTIAHLNNKYSQ